MRLAEQNCLYQDLAGHCVDTLHAKSAVRLLIVAHCSETVKQGLSGLLTAWEMIFGLALESHRCVKQPQAPGLSCGTYPQMALAFLLPLQPLPKASI